MGAASRVASRGNGVCTPARQRQENQVSPTQRTLAALRKMGLIVGNVERWIPRAMVRQDLFGWIDLVALDPEQKKICAVQSTGQDWTGHVRKICEEKKDMARLWLECGGIAELWAWRKVKRKGRLVYAPRRGVVRMHCDGVIVDELPLESAE